MMVVVRRRRVDEESFGSDREFDARKEDKSAERVDILRLSPAEYFWFSDRIAEESGNEADFSRSLSNQRLPCMMEKRQF